MNSQHPSGSRLGEEWVLAATHALLLACAVGFPRDVLGAGMLPHWTRGLFFLYLWGASPAVLGWTLIRFLKRAVSTGSFSDKAGVWTSLAGLAAWIDFALDEWIGGRAW